MVPISLYDDVRIRARVTRAPLEIDCRVQGAIGAPCGPANIAWQAADVVARALDLSARIDIRIVKRIPSQAGLGGGSSDAATVLRVLPRLLRRRLSSDRALELAAGLGADVPFFLDCRPSIARGIGEILEPLSGFPRLAMVVVVPAQGVDTAWAYRSALPPQCRRPLRERAVRSSLHAASLQLSRKKLLSRLSNDFESGVASSVTDVARLSSRLAELGAEHTVMSGSGSAVVGVFPDLRQARRAATAFDGEDRAFAVTGLAGRPAN